jgi:amidase
MPWFTFPRDGFDSSTIGPEVYEQSVTDLRQALDAGRCSIQRLAQACLERIAILDHSGPALHSVIEINPDALGIAAELDAELAERGPRSPLHGVPVLLKDNIDTADRMRTTAGSLALLSSMPTADAAVVRRLREAGALILGKTNLSEWANFRSTRSASGWSARGGQTRNPYVLDRNPCGSSSGSAAAVAASLCTVAVGTETDGSIIGPSALCGVVGIKPTVGLTSREGVVPISPTQDSVGVHGRSVADAAALLAVIREPHPESSDTYEACFEEQGLRGTRIGVLRDSGVIGYNPHTDMVFHTALQAIEALGAILIDPVHLSEGRPHLHDDEFNLMLYEFRLAIADYLATRVPHPDYADEPPPRNLTDLIAFNMRHAETEMPYFGQEIFHMAQAKVETPEVDYLEALVRSRDETRATIDAVMAEHRLDAIVAPSMQPAWAIDLLNGDHFKGGSSGAAARAGYPLITVPAGAIAELPLGISFIGRAWSEATLIRCAFAFEQAVRARRVPRYLAALPLR